MPFPKGQRTGGKKIVAGGKRGKPGDKNPAARAASKGGATLPKATRKNYKPPKPKKVKVEGSTCGAKKRHGGHCNMLAGWGTPHPGVGRCKFHGGSSPTHVKSAATGELRTLLGVPIEINPLDALLMCIRIRAGEVVWLGAEIEKLTKEEWVEDTMVGKQFHLYARERQHAMNDLARYSQMAISLGIAERAVKLAETYGELIANYTKGILDELWPHMTPEGREQAPQIVRRHLIALDGGRQTDVIDAEYKELPTGEGLAA